MLGTTDANRKYFCSMTATGHVKTFLKDNLYCLTCAGLRLKPEVQILGSSKNIRHTKVEILRLKSCFLHKKETNFHAKLIFESHFFCAVRDCFTLVCLMICIWRINRVPDPVLRDQPCHSWFNQERLVLKFPFVSLKPQCLPECLPLSYQVFDLETMRDKCRTYCLPNPSLKIIHGTPI